ncbi:MAG TPA: tRNA preQ1(34) S-adenosylmethionine ribosyltransferase-isomerase QueA [Gemmatimonadales bacterium]|nr:tRNA preQ1(34) S-adenosylmethionine ribosyltransferase-isomerase QueA [Gemmatimonadales bacterium]
MRTDDFDYQLPASLIAQQPLAERSASRLLVVPQADGAKEAGAAESSARPPLPALTPLPPFEDRHFTDLPSLIPTGDLLVLNTTRVRPARLLGTRPGGGSAEVLLIHPSTDGTWVAMGKPGSALRPGKRIRLDDEIEVETVEILEEGYRRVRFVGGTAETALARLGHMPLPPYIARADEATDRERYQTVYAEREGSVAAPTAGLHFTPQILAEIERKGVGIARIDLEVGPGTFRPVEEPDPSSHPMHPEHYEIPAAAADAITNTRERGGKVWAVGTTVVRTLETAARQDGTVAGGAGETRLLILPGYQFKVVDRLLTNFHLPRSTLLMLVCALGGTERILAAYRHAVEAKYRFYSYGDAMLIKKAVSR